MNNILKCQQCGKYTMKKHCVCGGFCVLTRPVRYSPDKYGKYRRIARKEQLEKKGLL